MYLGIPHSKGPKAPAGRKQGGKETNRSLAARAEGKKKKKKWRRRRAQTLSCREDETYVFVTIVVINIIGMAMEICEQRKRIDAHREHENAARSVS